MVSRATATAPTLSPGIAKTATMAMSMAMTMAMAMAMTMALAMAQRRLGCSRSGGLYISPVVLLNCHRQLGNVQEDFKTPVG